MRIVASLTTMPDKYLKIIKCLESLNNQTRKLDVIYLGLPKKSRRLGIEYPPLPKEVLTLCTIVDVEDFGPITKLLGALINEQDPETVIFTFDDDMVYPPTIVEELLECHTKYPNCALGSSGMLLKNNCPMCAINPNQNDFWDRIAKFDLPPEGRKVDSIWGYSGVLYVRKFFPQNENLEKDFLSYALLSDNMMMNDDIVISGYLSLKGIERRLFPNISGVTFVKNPEGNRERGDSEISYNMDIFFQKLNLAIDKAKSLGMYASTENVVFSETIFGLVFVTVLAFLAIILSSIYLVNLK